MTLNDFLEEYARTYAFETELFTFDSEGDICDECDGYNSSQCWKCGATGRRDVINATYKAIAINLGHTNSKVFDAVWRKKCKWCHGKGYHVHKWENRETICPDCNGTGHIEPYDLMIPFVRRKDQLWNVSLYSTKDHVDCGAIAKSYGGGGHKGAAGFQTEELPFEY